MKVTLSNGLVLEGTPEQIGTVAKQLGVKIGNDGVHYMSSTRGLIKITEMTEQHLRNAILKLEAQRLEELRALDLRSFIRALATGTNDITVLAMVAELGRRYR